VLRSAARSQLFPPNECPESGCRAGTAWRVCCGCENSELDPEPFRVFGIGTGQTGTIWRTEQVATSRRKCRCKYWPLQRFRLDPFRSFPSWTSPVRPRSPALLEGRELVGVSLRRRWPGRDLYVAAPAAARARLVAVGMQKSPTGPSHRDGGVDFRPFRSTRWLSRAASPETPRR
jgi:hypothetical protein